MLPLQPVLHMGFEWDTNEMSVLLVGPLHGMAACIVINSFHIKGDVRLHFYSLLLRQGNPLCAFESLCYNVARTYMILELVVMYFAVMDYANLGWAWGSLLIWDYPKCQTGDSLWQWQSVCFSNRTPYSFIMAGLSSLAFLVFSNNWLALYDSLLLHTRYLVLFKCKGFIKEQDK